MRDRTKIAQLAGVGGPWWLAVALVAGGLAAVGCLPGTVEFGGGACTHEGVSYDDGDSFEAADGCNTCSCDDGEVACTLIGCVDVCVHDGKTYALGESFPAGDGCNLCTCNLEGVECTDASCGPGTCTYGGETYEVGDSFPAGDGCNTCYCDEGGQVGCTEKACPQPVCIYGGVAYEPGESFPALDGCNTCFCGESSEVACTDMACPECDPDAEWFRHYVSTSPLECQLIDYACPDNTEGFQNDCGCGCEQSPECPEWFDCMPPSDCDPEKIAHECPYSKIAY